MNHRIESVVTYDGRRTAVTFCGIEEPLQWPMASSMAAKPATCPTCAEKMESVRRAEWAAVKP